MILISILLFQTDLFEITSNFYNIAYSVGGQVRLSRKCMLVERGSEKDRKRDGDLMASDMRKMGVSEQDTGDRVKQDDRPQKDGKEDKRKEEAYNSLQDDIYNFGLKCIKCMIFFRTNI